MTSLRRRIYPNFVSDTRDEKKADIEACGSSDAAPGGMAGKVCVLSGSSVSEVMTLFVPLEPHSNSFVYKTNQRFSVSFFFFYHGAQVFGNVLPETDKLISMAVSLLLISK